MKLTHLGAARPIILRLGRLYHAVAKIGGSAEGSGEHTRPRVWCSASRRTGFSGETPEIARGDACTPQPICAPTRSQVLALSLTALGRIHVAPGKIVIERNKL
jgi:hypothetical protein